MHSWRAAIHDAPGEAARPGRNKCARNREGAPTLTIVGVSGRDREQVPLPSNTAWLRDHALPPEQDHSLHRR